MNFLATCVGILNTLLWNYVLIVLLIGMGLYFTYRTNFVQFRYLKEMFRLLVDKSDHEGSISSFQAFCISTASRVGTGNIAGVAIAVTLGGPGAVFWMWLIALIGASSGFVESTLAQIYKTKDGDTFRGGPAYYIEKGLNKRWLGIVFSILITITFGFVFNAVQANTVTNAFVNAFNIDPVMMAVCLALVSGVVILGGVKRIAYVSQVIVPVFAIAYIIVALYVMLINFSLLPSIFGMIFTNAFSAQAVAGGALGSTIMQGIKRGLFSNEAGMGSAPNAAATADVSHPVKQGLVQALGVFTDTLVICSSTAFIILLSADYIDTGLEGIQLTQSALSYQVGAWGGVFIAICILLFAFTSIIGNYYYGESNIEFITENKWALYAYRLIVIIMVLWGSLVHVYIVWDMADLFMGLMAIINLYVIARLGKFAFLALNDYKAQRDQGIQDPVFKAREIPDLKNTTEWED